MIKKKKVLEINGDDYTALSMYLMPLNCTFKIIKMVKFMLFYHNERRKEAKQNKNAKRMQDTKYKVNTR